MLARVMGLSIRFKLETQRKLNPAAVAALLEKLREKAIALGFLDVNNLIAATPQHEWIIYRPPWAHKASELVTPHDGWYFAATPGGGCESMRVGLCRFAGAAGWRWESFCKTQYASQFGWEHFLKCHRGVVEMLWAAEELGIRVTAEDEGELWETGSHARLRRNLAEYDQSIATLGGALRRAARVRGADVQSPIFEQGEKISSIVEAVKRLVP
jgi:hypothetical protein